MNGPRGIPGQSLPRGFHFANVTERQVSPLQQIARDYFFALRWSIIIFICFS